MENCAYLRKNPGYAPATVFPINSGDFVSFSLVSLFSPVWVVSSRWFCSFGWFCFVPVVLLISRLFRLVSFRFVSLRCVEFNNTPFTSRATVRETVMIF